MRLRDQRIFHQSGQARAEAGQHHGGFAKIP
jgi:hypothetical protein